MKKIRKYKQRAIKIFVVIVLLLSGIGNFFNQSKAATYLINEANLYSITQITSFKYKGNPIVVEFVVYKKDGIEYPAYCLNRNLPGVTIDKEYDIKVEKEIESVAIWKVITNGYPFKTPSELGCNTIYEAYAATKMAVYDTMYHYDWNDFSPLLKAGERAIIAAEKIAKNAKNSTQTRPSAKIDVTEAQEEWKVDEKNPNYVSKTYKVDTNLKSQKYNVKLKSTQTDTMLVTDLNNNEKTEFSNGEQFKILVPIVDLIADGTFEIQVTADMETWPILYGVTGIPDTQDYAVTAGYISYEDAKKVEKYYKNKTKIEIIKQDSETKENLKGAKFNILDEEKKIIYSGLETNDSGTVQIENILPGKYYIQEEKAPDGYTGYNNNVEIQVELNQTYTVRINNYKKPESEEKEVEDKETVVTGEKEIALPRTGF